MSMAEDEILEVPTTPDVLTPDVIPSSDEEIEPPKYGGDILPMAKTTVGNIDWNTRDTIERTKYLPGCDIYCELNGSSTKTLTQCAAIIAASVALGSPFAYVIVGNKVFVDATDKTKTPYAALQTAVGA